MSPTVEKITLSNGYKIPVLGLGTWQGGVSIGTSFANDPGEVENAVKIAIDEGYRHFDCASLYGNEVEVGKAIQEKIRKGVVKREDLFIVTKIWIDENEEKLVVPACQRSLQKLGLDYLDLYLIHCPFSLKGVDYIETWRGMEKCVELGLTRSIGVSNFNSQQLTRLLNAATIKPVMNQIECHVNLNQKKLREFCTSKFIAVTAYSPFGAPYESNAPGPDINMQCPIITAIAKKYNKSNAQVVLRYLIDIRTIPIPKSSSPKRLRENIDVFDFKLTPQEISTINKLDCGFRTSTFSKYKDYKDYPFNIEF